MKKHLFILAGLLCFIGQNEAEAKAVKLGRSASISEQTRNNINFDGQNSTVFCPPNCLNCDTSSACTLCKSGYYLSSSGTCSECPNNATCNGTGTIYCNSNYYLNGSSCSSCANINVANGSCTACTSSTNCTAVSCNAGYRKSGKTCVANCSDVICKPGNIKVSSANGCCCEACPSGSRPTSSGTACESNCTGVICKSSNYTKISNSQGCCCEEQNNTTCPDMMVFNPAIGKCVQMVCPSNCNPTDMCMTGCSGCRPGYYLSYHNGMCPSCSSAIANCTACTSSASGVTCTACESGYYLNASGTCSRKTLVLDDTIIDLEHDTCFCSNPNLPCRCIADP